MVADVPSSFGLGLSIRSPRAICRDFSFKNPHEQALKRILMKKDRALRTWPRRVPNLSKTAILLLLPAGARGSMCPSRIERPMAIPFGSTQLVVDVGSTQARFNRLCWNYLENLS